MSGKSQELEQELGRLIAKGDLLYCALAKQVGRSDKRFLKALEEKEVKLPVFSREYEDWYSVALRVVAQVLPDRLSDFILQYKNEKRKSIDFLTYTISDALLGLQTSRAGEVIADASAALGKFERQVSILKSAQAAFNSSLTNLAGMLQADLFDSELEAAAELGARGFFRAAGAMAGVVLEKHLAHVCELHTLKSGKKHASIGDLNQVLKDAAIIDIAKWRFVQHLADIRNLCDHKAVREPTNDDIAELVEGVAKIIKTVN